MTYLTVNDYVTRYGARETGLLTNTTATPGAPGSYDSTKVERAIEDATEEVEAYISKRYAIPLSSPPPIVKGWVAAIGRLKLAETTGRVSEAVQAAADRATRQLEQLVANKIDLPVPENTTPPAQVGTGRLMTSNDRASPVFGNSVLDAFTAPFTGGGCLPRWRE